MDRSDRTVRPSVGRSLPLAAHKTGTARIVHFQANRSAGSRFLEPRAVASVPRTVPEIADLSLRMDRSDRSRSTIRCLPRSGFVQRTGRRQRSKTPLVPGNKREAAKGLARPVAASRESGESRSRLLTGRPNRRRAASCSRDRTRSSDRPAPRCSSSSKRSDPATERRARPCRFHSRHSRP